MEPNARPGWTSGVGEEERGLRRWVRIVRDHWDIIIPAMLVTLAVAVGFSLLKEKQYEAQATVLASSVARDDGTYTGMSVLRESSDPTRDVETLAKLIATPVVAQQAAAILGNGATPGELLGKIQARPISQSFLVAITADGSTPEEAAAIANAFGDGLIAARKAEFNAQLTPIITRLQAQLRGSDGADSEIAARLAALRTLEGGPDPSVQFVTRATPPGSSTSLPLPFVMVAGLVVGAGIGLGAAFLSEAFRSRIRSERDLLQVFNLPVLARVPFARRTGVGRVPLSPDKLPAPAAEAYRTLRQNIVVLGPGREGPRVVAVTSAAPSEGKSTSALNTAVALAEGGGRVLLVDADLRQPSIGTALAVASRDGVLSVLSGAVPLREAVLSIARWHHRVLVLLPRPDDAPRAELITRENVRSLVHQAKGLVDYIVFDTPPLGVVADALPVATESDDVLMVVRRGSTSVRELNAVGETLARHGVTPRGFVLVGAEDGQTDRGYQAYYLNVERETALDRT